MYKPELDLTPGVQTGALASTPINYFSRASYEKLGLIQGEGDVFRYLLKLLSDYEGKYTP